MFAISELLNSLREKVIGLGDDPKDYWQWAGIAVAVALAWVVSRIMGRTLFAEGSRFRTACERFFRPKRHLGAFPASLAVLLWIAYLCARPAPFFEDGALILRTAALLATAYAIYRLALSLSHGMAAPRVVGVVMLVTIILEFTQMLRPVVDALQTYRVPLGDLEISPWAILSGLGALFLLLWLANLSSRALDSGLNRQRRVPASMQVLLGKLARFVFYAAAILIALKIGGFNLGALAIFSGALGLGIGFGLQKVISNLVSGIIILLDKSIKPGDVIEIGDAYGYINSLRTRYVSVITRDQKEYLIPNEDFITNQVINWTFSGAEIRIRADVGIAYGSDVRKAIELCIEAARAQDRVLANPDVNCLLMGFGDSSVDLQIRFWISDPANGVANVRSAVLLAVWDSFKEHGIEIPFPQRDLHLKSAAKGIGFGE